MSFEINVSNIPDEPFLLSVRQSADKRCAYNDPPWITDVVSNGVQLYLCDVMMQAGRHFADSVNPESFVHFSRRQSAMALAWAITSMVSPSVVANELVVQDPIDQDVKRLCSEILGVGLALEMLRACRLIDARTLRKMSARFDFEGFRPNGGGRVRIEAKGTFNNASTWRHRNSIATKIADLTSTPSYHRVVGIIASLWTPDRQRTFDIEITDPERDPHKHFEEAVREVIRFYAHRFGEAVGNAEGVEDLLGLADDPDLFAERSPATLSRLGTEIRPSRRFWRGRLTLHEGATTQYFLGAFWDRHLLPIPLSIRVPRGASARAYMGVDARVLEVIRRRRFRELITYKPSYTGLLKASGTGYDSIFQLDEYGILRGLVVGDLPMSVEAKLQPDS
jgi:hypothetical protein